MGFWDKIRQRRLRKKLMKGNREIGMNESMRILV